MKRIVLCISIVVLIGIATQFLLQFKTDTRLGQNYLEAFEHDKAIAFFTDYVEKNPSNAEALFYLAESIKEKAIYARYKELTKEQKKVLFEQAENNYLKAIELDPERANYKFSLSKMYKYQKKYKMALDVYKTLEKEGSQSQILYEQLGNIYSKLDQPELSNKYYKLAGIKKISKSNNIVNQKFEIIETMSPISSNKKIKTKIEWIVTNMKIYSHKVQSTQYAQKIIQDVHSGCLSKYIRSSQNSSDFTMSDEIKKQVNNCNDEVLKDWGISIRIISLSQS